MSKINKILVPDLGNYQEVDVIDVAVKEGDIVKINDTLMTLETDKATMDVPADKEGKIISLKVKIGDKVSQGSVIAEVEALSEPPQTEITNPKNISNKTDSQKLNQSSQNNTESIQSIIVPDIGNFKQVDVIDVMVKVGDDIKINDNLITLETDKATMDVPADKEGTITDIKLKIGDKVSQGDTILLLKKASHLQVQSSDAHFKNNDYITQTELIINHSTAKKEIDNTPGYLKNSEKNTNKILKQAHAGPAVRKLARELGVDLLLVTGSGPHQRILKEDVKNYVQQKLQSSHTQNSNDVEFNILPWPKIDFTQFGKIEKHALGRIKKISGKNLSRNWVMIPHVTQHDEADMTELEEFRKTLNKEWENEGLKVSPLAFIIQASVKALKTFPEFNASLEGDNLIFKKYYHIGFAADTPQGLVVPVIKHADQKGLKEITQELKNLSSKARAGKLTLQEMQGASFTISSLGGIGGIYFTPIINAPEVAILGVCKSRIQPVWNGSNFQPRLMCPLSLSYDHRVIDGALACRFTTYLVKILADYKRILL